MSARRFAPALALALALAGLAGCSRTPASEQKAEPPAAATPLPAPQPAPPPAYEVRLGREVFVHYCATCHGDAGAGDGFNAYNLDPHPRDLSDPALQKKKSDADLADTIRRGGSGVGLSSLMPPWGRTLSERQVAEVVLYLRTLEKTAPPAPGSGPKPSAHTWAWATMWIIIAMAVHMNGNGASHENGPDDAG